MKRNSTETETPRCMKSSVANIGGRYVPSGVYFARAKVGGKLIRSSLKTGRLSVAQLRLAGHTRSSPRSNISPPARMQMHRHQPIRAASQGHHCKPCKVFILYLQGNNTGLRSAYALVKKYDIYDVCHIPFGSHSCEYLHQSI